MTLEDIAIENQRLVNQLESYHRAQNNAQIIQNAASHIRDKIREFKGEQAWPLYPTDLDRFPALPIELKMFFTKLLTGESNPKSISARVERLIDSFTQDLVYAVTNGEYKPKKHILLANAVKSLTGNTELLQALNRLGHCISYSTVEENETDMCLQKLEKSHTNIPSTLKPRIPTTLAWDNIDILEETVTGSGTTHRINGIAIQPNVFGPDPPENFHMPKKSKMRSINLPPSHLPIYNSGQRCGPQKIKIKDNDPDRTEVISHAFARNVLWVLCRQISTTNQIIPSWTGFNIKTRKNVPVRKDKITYLPTIAAPATEMSSCAEILSQSEKIRNELAVDSLVVVLDQALYAKVSEVLWKTQPLYKGIVLRMGEFHTICNFLSIIGKRFQDAGLRDLCVESGIVAEGSVNAVMNGKHYNRAVRIHKCVFEALMRMVWKKFVDCLSETHRNDILTDIESITTLNKFLTDDEPDWVGLNSLVDNVAFERIISALCQCLVYLRKSNGPLSEFWMSYLDMVGDTLLGLLRSSREGDWELHLASVRSMLPWCFAYDHVNYARYLTVYFMEMSNLKQSHPDVHEHFTRGGFSAQIGNSNPFGKIPVDQATEETVNKDSKTAGGVRRFSLNDSAVARYYMTSEFRCFYLWSFRYMLDLVNKETNHTDLGSSRIKADEMAVLSVMNTLENWANPFDGHDDLISLSTATAATPTVASDLQMANAIGEQEFSKFKEERLLESGSNEQAKSFYDPLPKNRLKTFSNMNGKKKITTMKGREIILRCDRNLFSRMILAAKTRKDIDLRVVFRHPLGPLPWALATADGTMRKTNKSSLSKDLQKNVVAFAEEIPTPRCTLIDGMALVQKSACEQKTFGQIASSLLSYVLREAGDSKRIDVVFDVYRELSIKDAEREKRGSTESVHFKDITSGQIVRQGRKFLRGNTNKTALVNFLIDQWASETQKSHFMERTFIATAGQECFKLERGTKTPLHELNSSQEEADTRLFLHAAHAAQTNFGSIVIASEDTDVFVLCLSIASKIDIPIFVKTGTSARTRYIDVNRVVATHGKETCDALVGLHAFTGCDSVSAFAGRGKVASLKLISVNVGFRETFTQLGCQINLSDSLLEKLEFFTCALYGQKKSTTNVNDLRYNIFCTKGGRVESHQLPPCLDCLRKHSHRANYQTYIWRRCLHGAEP